MKNSIGIGLLTTPNREIINTTLPLWYKYLPEDAALIVENDTEFTGVAKTSNRLLAQLDDFEHIFLINDDVKPLVKDWCLPYIKSGENHLMLQFKLPGKPKSDMRELYRDNRIVAYSHCRGAFIYIRRVVLDVVGGFDEAYGAYGFEHSDYTNRIHAAGLTTFRAADVARSEKLLYCFDKDAKVTSSVSDKSRHDMLLKNYKYYKSQRNSKEWKAYK